MRIEIDGVLFDSDGVLVDSHAQVDAAWRTIAEELAIPSLAVEHHGVRAVDVLGRHLSGDALDRAVARVTELELDGAREIRAVPGAAGLIASLPVDRWAVVTSAGRHLAERRWAGAGLDVEASVTADEVRAGKPDPDPYERGAALLGLDPAACVVFEDTASGAEAATRAGCRVVAVGAQPWGVEPLARVPDLRSVRVEAGHTAAIALVVD